MKLIGYIIVAVSGGIIGYNFGALGIVLIMFTMLGQTLVLSGD